jgi:NAD(P)H-hydrate epimerase
MPSLIYGINRSGLPVLSIDVPSGDGCDSSIVKGSVVKATSTLCLGAMKLSTVFFPAGSAYGKVGYSPICFDEKLLVGQPSQMEMYTEEDALDFLPAKTYRSTKYTAGKVLIISGCRGMHGAAALAANAALRAGAGLVRAVVPGGIYRDVSAHLLEVIGTPVGSEQDYHFVPEHVPEILPWIEWADSILIGNGLGKDPGTLEFLERIMPSLRGRRVVVDGDGLHYFDPAKPERRQGKELEHFLVTPHAGEYKRLGGNYDYETPMELLENLRTFAKSGSIGIVLKGPTTVFTGPDGKHVIITAGNPGMATAGSGDVLAGILTAFLAKKPREEAAPLAVFLHGRSGDAARRDRGTLGMAASDLILYLPLAIKELEDLLLDLEDDDEEEG